MKKNSLCLMNRLKIVYVCHPYSADPAGNVKLVVEWCKKLSDMGYVPLAPQLFMAQYINEETESEVAMEHCLALVDCCHEMWVFYPGQEENDYTCSAGQRQEIERAIAAWGQTARWRICHVWGSAERMTQITRGGTVKQRPAEEMVIGHGEE